MNLREAYEPFRALGGAWRLLQQATLTMLVGGILLLLLDGSGYNFNYWQEENVSDEEAALLVFLGCICCLVGIAAFLFSCLLRVGFATAVERVMRSGEEQLGDLFRSRDRWLAMVFTQILLVILSVLSFLVLGALSAGAFFLGAAIGDAVLGALFLSLAAIPCIIAWFYVYLGISLAPDAVAIESMWPFDALGRSWSLVRGNRLWLFWYYLVTRLFTLAGFCVCCVGVFLTGPLVYIADYEAYIRMVRGDTGGWWIEQPPQPPASPFDDSTDSTGPAAPTGEA